MKHKDKNDFKLSTFSFHQNMIGNNINGIIQNYWKYQEYFDQKI
jgi:hypothetical protein